MYPPRRQDSFAPLLPSSRDYSGGSTLSLGATLTARDQPRPNGDIAVHTFAPPFFFFAAPGRTNTKRRMRADVSTFSSSTPTQHSRTATRRPALHHRLPAQFRLNTAPCSYLRARAQLVGQQRWAFPRRVVFARVGGWREGKRKNEHKKAKISGGGGVQSHKKSVKCLLNKNCAVHPSSHGSLCICGWCTRYEDIICGNAIYNTIIIFVIFLSRMFGILFDGICESHLLSFQSEPEPPQKSSALRPVDMYVGTGRTKSIENGMFFAFLFCISITAALRVRLEQRTNCSP